MEKKYWIWYPGDFELYHAMKQNFSRIERGLSWPAFWKCEGFRNRVVFRRTYHLEKDTRFLVHANGIGHVLVGNQKYPFEKEIFCSSGEISISIHTACIEKFPSIYIEGDTIYSDENWQVEDYDKPLVPVGFSKYFTKPTQTPSIWEYSEREYLPIRIEEREEGVLYEFETELTAAIEVKLQGESKSNLDSSSQLKSNIFPQNSLKIFCGESREEALDKEHCYLIWEIDFRTGKGRSPRCAVCYDVPKRNFLNH